MKKAQILSVVALAFALGVTPVIATVNTVSAFTVADADKNVEGSATQAEVENAVAAVKGTYPAYNNWIALEDLFTREDDPVSASDDLASTSGKADVAETITTFLGTNYSTIDTSKVFANGNTYVQQITAAVTAAQKAENYSLVSNLLQAIEDESDVNLRKAIAAINTKFGTQIRVDDDVTVENYSTAPTGNTTASQVVNAFGGAYNNLETLVNDVNAAVKARDTYTSSFNALSNALKADGILTTEGRNKLASVLGTTNPTIESLIDILNNTGAAAGKPYVSNRAAWAAVAAAVDSAKTAQSFAGNYNYNLIVNIAKALQTAVPVLDKTAPQIAAQLAGYAAPATRTLTVSGANTTVTATGAFPEGVELKIVKSDDKVAAFGDYNYKMWNITLVKDGKEVSYEGNVTVTIKVPEGIDGAKAGVYFVDGEGNAQRYASTYKDGALTFTTTHFSLWAIVEDNGKVLDTPKAPTTGTVSSEAGATTTVAMVAGLATALTAAGAGVVAYRNARRSTRK